MDSKEQTEKQSTVPQYLLDIDFNIKELSNAKFHSDPQKNQELKEKYIKITKEWLVEKAIKNNLIKNGKIKEENIHRKRQRIYWTEFGVGVGSEFSLWHFSVVLKEFDKVVTVIPLTTKNSKEENISLGIIERIDKNKEVFAVIGQIQTLSKTRLSQHKINGQYVDVLLDKEKMNLIYDGIKKIGNQTLL